jgi:hypothetical protein
MDDVSRPDAAHSPRRDPRPIARAVAGWTDAELRAATGEEWSAADILAHSSLGRDHDATTA